MVSKSELTQMLKKYNLDANVPAAKSLIIDTANSTPSEVARKLARYYRLPIKRS